MKIGCCGLKILMAEAVSDIRDRIARYQHIDGAGMSETVNGIEMVQLFGGKSPLEVFLADSVDAMAS